MQDFITLVKLSPEIRQKPYQVRSLIETLHQQVQNAGGKIVSADGLLGRYDLCVKCQLPDVKTAFSVWLKASTPFGYTTETFPAIQSQEIQKVAEEAGRVAVGSGR